VAVLSAFLAISSTDALSSSIAEAVSVILSDWVSTPLLVAPTLVERLPDASVSTETTWLRRCAACPRPRA
jgi:hypothetical protein